MESNWCATIEDLNDLVISGEIRQLIRLEEAMHEMQFCHMAEEICRKGTVVVMISGPSASGKTTSANRLATQLRAHGKKPVLISLDDYYIDRDKIPPEPDGKLDLEHINAIDVALFIRNLGDLMLGKKVRIPIFNFKTGKREWKSHGLQLEESSVIIVEGLHALNPVLLPRDPDNGKVFRIYVCPQLPPEFRIPDYRLLRRILRDYESRGTSVQRTVAMWDSVRQGEQRWILPFRKTADIIFNSSMRYEPAVLKKHMIPLLPHAQPEGDVFGSIVHMLDCVQEADVDDEIPPTSILREFIGGNTFCRK